MRKSEKERKGSFLTVASPHWRWINIFFKHIQQAEQLYIDINLHYTNHDSNGKWPSSDSCCIKDPLRELSATMLCLSLRQRKDWAKIVPALSRSTSLGWKGKLKVISL